MKFQLLTQKMSFAWAGVSCGAALLLAQTASAQLTFTATPTNGTAPLTVNFTPPSGIFISYSWTFGDGVGTSTSPNPIYTYTNIGTFSPALTVTPLTGGPQNATGPTITAIPGISFAPTSGALNSPRVAHTTTLLLNGLVLVAGGTNIAGGGVLSTAELYNPATGTWTPTGSLTTGRVYHTATLLGNGMVLVAGGQDTNGNSISNSELYIPGSGTWLQVGALNTARAFHTATLLTNGMVLVAGGRNSPASAIAIAELFNPNTFTWTNTGPLTTARITHTATLLTNGMVLVAAGETGGGTLLNSAELYDPLAGTWTTTSNAMNTARYYHTATLLTNGQVLVAGGGIANGTLTNTEMFDPVNQTWTPAGPLNEARFLHTATLLPNGEVLLAGGSGNGGSSNYLSSAEVYDPATEAWFMTGPLNAARYRHTATMLPSGEILMTGGTGSSGIAIASSELAVPPTNAPPGFWTTTNSLSTARYRHTATLLPNGKVLVAGGESASFSMLSNAEVYNPSNGTWNATSSMNAARGNQTATLLTSGQVLVAGGYSGGYLSSAELYNPANGTWTTTGSLNTARYLHTTTLLTNGLGLVAGGEGTNSYLSAAELFNPSTGTWTNTGSMTNAREYHTATLLTNGLVLVAGGYGINGITNSAELYNPSTGTWAATGSMINAHEYHTATLLPNGLVLVAGGYGINGVTNSAELYNPSTGTWAATGPLNTARNFHTATLLPNGLVLVAGGSGNSGVTNSVELYNPATGTWTVSGSLNTARDEYTATLLPNGLVLAAGGNAGATITNITELYNVNLGFSPSSQPQITSVLPILDVSNGQSIVVIEGSKFRGISEGSGGNGSQDSPADYPVVQLSSLANGQTLFLSSGLWSNNLYESTLISNFPSGYTLATAFVNGIPSASSIFNFGGVLTPSACAPAPSSLVYWWQAESNALDSVGGNNGTLQGRVTYTNGEVGEAFNLDGSTGFISTSTLITNPQTFSLSMWFKTATTTNGGVLIAFDSSQTSVANGSQFDRNVYMDDSGVVRFGVWTGSATQIISSSGYNDSNWHFVVGSLSASTGLSLYLDGALVGNNPNVTNAPLNFNGYVRMGEDNLNNWPDQPSSYYFKGQIDEVAIFKRAISSNEVAAIYAAGSAGMCFSGDVTINFDDLNVPSNNGIVITNGYHGLNWNNFHLLNTPLYTLEFSTNGYANGTVSSPNVAFDYNGNLAGFSSSTPFILNSGDFTAAWNNGLNLEVIGINGATTEYDTNYTLNTSGPLLISFPNVPVTTVNFVASGGTNAGFDGGGPYFALDNLVVSGDGISPSVTLTTPTNGQSFSAPANITLSAVTMGGSSVAFYSGTNLLGQTTTPPFSITVSNLPAGSYPVFAVAASYNGLSAAASSVAHVTVNAPGTTLIDFEAVDASSGPVSGAVLSNYLASYGVTVSNVSTNTTLAVQEDQNIFNGTVTKANSGQNLLTQIGANGAISNTLVFNASCTSVSWVRTKLLAGSAGVVTPAWTAYAYDINGNALGQVGENQVFSTTDVPAATFKLLGPNIAYITFAANNNIGELDSLPLDDLLLSTNGIGATPGISLTSSNFASTAPGGITLAAQAFENGGAISRIDFYENKVLIGSPATSPSGTNTIASITLSNLAAGTYTFYAVATDTNGAVRSSTSLIKTVTAGAGIVVINFDDPIQLPTSAGAVGGTNLSNYLSGFGVTITNVTLGTRLEAINQSSFSGNELPVPSSLPNLLTQVGSSQPVTFTLKFATNQEYVSFTRAGLLTNGPSAISHPAWTAQILDPSGNELASAGEPLIFSPTNIPPRTFTLATTTGISNIASLRFNSDSQQTAAFSAVLLDDLVLNVVGLPNPLSISIASPANGTSNFTAPAAIPINATVGDGYGTNYHVAFYSGPTLIGNSSSTGTNFTWSNVLNGTYTLRARVLDANGSSLLSAPVTITVQPGGNSTVVNFDALNASNAPVTGAPLTAYLGGNGMIVASNSPGTSVVVENQASVAGGGFVTASSPPNVLTQTGSNGPMSFTVGFSNLLSQFSFTRPQLLANPFVTQPGWQVRLLDPLGDVLASAQEPVISSYTNVPAKTYTLNAQGIAGVEVDSTGTGLSTFPAMLLDDFVLTAGNSVLITNPLDGQIITASLQIPVGAVAAAAGNGTVTNVAFYYGGTNLAGSAQTSPFTNVWNAPSNGLYNLTAVSVNNSGQAVTSAPVAVIVATGFAFTSFPASSTIPVGGSNVFSVTTTATNTVSYQWQLNGSPISGATLSSYTITNASMGDTGSYTVVAGNAGQSITSQPPAVLTVLNPPVASPIMQMPATINIGNTVTLTEMATPTNSPVPFTYQWLLNGTAIAGATNSSYTISNAQPINSGNYQVVVGDIVAFVQSPTFYVAVNFGSNATATTNSNFASSIPINPLIGPVAAINSNSPATGELAFIAGKPAGKFLWFNWTASFTGVISLTTRGSSFDTVLGVYTGTDVSALTTVAEDDDSGGFFTSLATFNCVQGTTYQIAVAGYKGAAGTIILGQPSGTGYRVLDPTSGDAVPVITQQPANQIVNAGDTVTLGVTASNAVSYQWYFGGASVSGGNSSTLVISNFTTASSGNYHVLAINDVGAAQSATAAIQIAAQNQNGTMSTPTTLTVDKFGDAVDLTGTDAPARYRPEDAGGDTGGFTLSQSFSTAEATKEEGEPNHAGQPGGASYWYTYTALANGRIRFDTIGSSFNTILAIYTSPSPQATFSTLVNVGAAYTTNFVQTGQPVVLVSNVTSGTTFYIAIDGYLGASGAAHLDVVLNPSTNLTVNTNIPPITNNNAIVAITSPANNSLTTVSNITVSGTLRGGAGKPLGQTFVQVTVNTNPPVTATLGAARATVAWTLANVTLVAGQNTITVQAVSPQLDGTTNASFPVTRTVFLVPALPSPSVKSTLTLATSGNGRITGLANNAGLEVNKIYKVTAVPAANWLFTNWTSGTNAGSLTPLAPNNAALSFVMSSNLILQANFVTNPFPAVAGVYNGLFAPTNGVTEESSGFFTATIPPSGHGAYSAKLLLDGGSYPFSGTFDLSGDAGTALARPKNTSLIVELHLNLAAPDDQITGMIIDGANPGWTSPLQADRAVFNARSNPATNAGRYTLILPPGASAPTNDPGGYGYATLTNNPSGQVSLVGQLGDGTAISQSVPVSKDGFIPLYVSLYSRQGSLLGWLTLTNNASNNPAQTILGSNLSWIKLSSRAGTLYSGGFTNTNITILGSLYVPPHTGANALALTNGTLTISNGNLGSALVYSNLTIVNNKLVNNNPNNPPNPLSGVITPGTGILTVTFRATGARANTVAKGVVLQDGSGTNAAGWFLGTGQSGFFLLQQ